MTTRDYGPLSVDEKIALVRAWLVFVITGCSAVYALGLFAAIHPQAALASLIAIVLCFMKWERLWRQRRPALQSTDRQTDKTLI